MSVPEPPRPRIAIPRPTSRRPDYNERAWPFYEGAVMQSGGTPVPIELDHPNATIATLIAGCSGVLLPGSPADVNPSKYNAQRQPETADADPARENADELLLQDAFNLRKPILAICYGAQSLNVWKSGTLIQHLADGAYAHRASDGTAMHPVAVDPESMLAEILSSSSDVRHTPETLRLTVNSSHHQAIARAGDGLRVVARSPRDAVIEAVEGVQPDHFVLALQWHPERSFVQSAASRLIFAAFLRAATEWRLRPPQTGE
jgi:putative glutamine amidotransferase